MSLAGLWVTRFGTRSPELTGHRLGWGKGQGWTTSSTGNLGQGSLGTNRDPSRGGRVWCYRGLLVFFPFFPFISPPLKKKL